MFLTHVTSFIEFCSLLFQESFPGDVVQWKEQ